MSNKIQKQKPIRTCKKTYTDYKSFKPYIVTDFNNRCGYCDSHDKFFGGLKNFQIDHFKPHSIPAFLSLKHEYKNLIYSCQSCNRAKSNKWKDTEGFIDPCDIDYDTFIFRDTNGKIKHNETTQGEYIHSNLNLFLKRHEFLWIIEKLENQKNEIKELRNSTPEIDSNTLILLLEFEKVQSAIDKYSNLLYVELSN
ncbi:HNH endonuclease [Aliarcobacter butzleri]|uniref:HNH endonuclease n=1 Tax=Aliarcobacter butzleri TaxID=28197 RepID=UPI0021B32D39|nr:HNH endonuclease signature motif containing protein [Aliarcobacter butzleri]MCT7567824.1 HNH endonuclease [Aliarcobacter butzleri]